MRDTIKTKCAAYRVGNQKAKYICFDDNNKLTHFDPKGEWEEMPGNDSRCKALEISLDTIKDFEFEIDADIVEKNGKPGKNGKEQSDK